MEDGSGEFFAKAGDLRARFQPGQVLLTRTGLQVTLRFEREARSVSPQGDRPTGARYNFLTARSNQHAEAYQALIYPLMYQGVTVRFTIEQESLKSEYEVGPGTEVQRIRFRYEEAKELQIDTQGRLLVSTGTGSLVEQAPVAFQDLPSGRRTVTVMFALHADRSIGFSASEYDHSFPLIIDPYFLADGFTAGGSGMDILTSMALDGAGFVYLAGYTDSPDFPLTGLGIKQGGVNAFVLKLNPTTNQIVYSTYLGGSGDDRAMGLAVDIAGNAYVVGCTSSVDFPVVSAAQSKLAGGRNGFVARLNAAGSGLTFSTYLGGSGSDAINAVALSPTGDLWVAGETTSANFPVQGAYQATSGGGRDVLVAKFTAAGALTFSSYLGGTGDDRATSIATDTTGRAYLTGSTQSINFPVLGAVQASSAGGQDAFVAAFNISGSSLLFSTYLGGSGGSGGLPEEGESIAIDPAGNIIVAGTTSSTNFPLVAPVQAQFGGGTTDAFIARLSPQGASLNFSSYLGGSSTDEALAVAVLADGSIYLAGATTSWDLPLAGAIQATNAGIYDAFIAEVVPGRSLPVFCSYLGGSASDSATALALDPLGNIYVAGSTFSNNFLQGTAPKGLSDIFLAKLASSPSKMGIFLTINSSPLFVLDSNNDHTFTQPPDASIQWVQQAAYVPVAGDWNGSGNSKIGTYSNGSWFLDYNGNGTFDGSQIDRVYSFGNSACTPLVGDWNGDGTTKVGVYCSGLFFLDTNGNGVFDAGDQEINWGPASGAQAVVGDWNGDGRTKIGIFSSGFWYLDYNGNGVYDGPQVDRAYSFGTPSSTPLVGDWNGDGKAKIGIYTVGLFFLDMNGNGQFDAGDRQVGWGPVSGAQPVLGDWNGDGRTKIGFYSAGTWALDIDGTFTYNSSRDGPFGFGTTTSVPLVGRWK